MKVAIKLTTQQRYNTKIKISGNHIEIKRFKKSMGHNIKGSESVDRVEQVKFNRKLTEQEKETKHYANLKVVRKRIFDLINANVRNNKDYLGNHQRIKFCTLTFDKDISVEDAYRELTKFMGRLSYYHFGINKNVIKYLSVFELQESGRIHFHVVFFNMPYISNKKKENYPLAEIWGNGYVFINALKRKNGKNIDLDKIAGYIVKYMTKETAVQKEDDVTGERRMRIVEESAKNIYEYETYKNLGLENVKKYSASKGLKKPNEYTLFCNAEGLKRLIKYIKEGKSLKKNKNGEYLSSYAYDININVNGDDHNGETSININSIWVAEGSLKYESIENIKEYVDEMTWYYRKDIKSSYKKYYEEYEKDYKEIEELELQRNVDFNTFTI